MKLAQTAVEAVSVEQLIMGAHFDNPPALQDNDLGGFAQSGEPVGDGERGPVPFAGSGPTLIAAERTGRICYAGELETRYCDVIVARWEALTGSTAAPAERRKTAGRRVRP